jgi:exodeoxyribonuclease VII small subunit
MADEKISFETAYKELEETVRRLEAGDLTLEESLALFQRGTELAKLCGERLDQVELQVSKLVSSPQGEPETAPFEDWEEGGEPGTGLPL